MRAPTPPAWRPMPNAPREPRVVAVQTVAGSLEERAARRQELVALEVVLNTSALVVTRTHVVPPRRHSLYELGVSGAISAPAARSRGASAPCQARRASAPATGSRAVRWPPTATWCTYRVRDVPAYRRGPDPEVPPCRAAVGRSRRPVLSRATRRPGRTAAPRRPGSASAPPPGAAPRRDQHGAARPHRLPLAVRLHRRPGGALQDVVDPGMLPVVVGAGVRLDLDPEKVDGATRPLGQPPQAGQEPPRGRTLGVPVGDGDDRAATAMGQGIDRLRGYETPVGSAARISFRT
jgi:hypothetical protein